MLVRRFNHGAVRPKRQVTPWYAASTGNHDAKGPGQPRRLQRRAFSFEPQSWNRESPSAQTKDDVAVFRDRDSMVEMDGLDQLGPWVACWPARGRAITSFSSIRIRSFSIALFVALPLPPLPTARALSSSRRRPIGMPFVRGWRRKAWTRRAAQDCGQLTVVDADELLPQFMRDAMPDAPVFLGWLRT